MHVKFFLANGAIVEWPVPATMEAAFSFPKLCEIMRRDGYLQTENLFIPLDALIMVGFENVAAGFAVVEKAAGAKPN